MKKTNSGTTPRSQRWLRILGCILLLIVPWTGRLLAQDVQSTYLRGTEKTSSGAIDMDNAFWYTMKLQSSGKYLRASANDGTLTLTDGYKTGDRIDPYAEWAFVFEQEKRDVFGRVVYLYRFINRGKGTSYVLRGNGSRGDNTIPAQMLTPASSGVLNSLEFTFRLHNATDAQANKQTAIDLGGYMAPNSNDYYRLSGTGPKFQKGNLTDAERLWIFRSGSLPGSCFEIKARSYIHSQGLVGGQSNVSALERVYTKYKTDTEWGLNVREEIDKLDQQTVNTSPTSGKHYRIQSGHFGFYEKGTKKSVLIASANGAEGSVAWGPRNENDANQVWKYENGKLINLGTGQRLNFANATTTGAGASVTIRPIGCAPGHYKITVNNQTLHANGHNSGNSTNGTIVNYAYATGGTKGIYDFDDPDGAPFLDGASSWMFEEVPQSQVTTLSGLTDIEKSQVQSYLAPIGVVYGFTTSNDKYRTLLSTYVDYTAGRATKQQVLTAMQALKTYYEAQSTSKVDFTLEGVYYIRNGSFGDFTFSKTQERARLFRHENSAFSWTLNTRDLPTGDTAPTEWSGRPLNEKWLIRRNPSNATQYSLFNLGTNTYITHRTHASSTEVWLTLEQIQNAFFAIRANGETLHAQQWNYTNSSGAVVAYEKDPAPSANHLFRNGAHYIASPSTWFLEPASLPGLSDQEKAQIMAFLANTRVVHGFVDPTATAELRRRYTTVTDANWSTQPLAKRSADLYRLRQEMAKVKTKYAQEKNDPNKVIQWDPNKVYRLRNGGIERWADNRKYYAFVNDANVPKAHLTNEEITGTASDRELWIIVASDASGTPHTFMNVATGRYLSTAEATSFDAVGLNTQLYRDEDYPGYYRINIAGQSAPLHALQRNQDEIGLGNWLKDDNEKDFHNGDPVRLNSGSTWLFEPITTDNQVAQLTATEVTMTKGFMGSVGVVDGFRTTNDELTQLSAAYNAWSTDQNNAFKRAKVRAWAVRTKERYHMSTTSKVEFEDGGIYLLRNGAFNAMVNSPLVERVVAHLPDQIRWQLLGGTGMPASSNPSDAQKWIVRRNNSGKYSLQNVATGKYLSGPGTVSDTPTWLTMDKIGRTVSGSTTTDTYPAFFSLVAGGQNVHALGWQNLATTSANLTNYIKDGSDPSLVHLYENGQAVRHSASTWQLKPAPARPLTPDEYRKAKLYAWAEGIVGGFYSCDVSSLRTLLGISSTSPTPKALTALSDKEKTYIHVELVRLSSATRIPFVPGGYYYIRSMKEGFLEQGVQVMMYEKLSDAPTEGRRTRWKRTASPATDPTVIWRITGGIGGSQNVQIANFSSGTYLVGLRPMFPTDQGYCQVLYINPTEAPGRVRLFLGSEADPRKPHPDRHAVDQEGRLSPWNNTASVDPDKYNNSDEVRGLTNEPITESVSSWALVPVDAKACASDPDRATMLPALTEEMKTHVRDYLASEGFVKGYTTSQLSTLRQTFRDGSGDARATFEALMQVKGLSPIAFDPAKYYRLHRANRSAASRTQVMYVDYKLSKTQTTALNQPKAHASDPSLVSELWSISALNTANAKVSNPNTGSIALSGAGSMTNAGSCTVQELQAGIHPGMIQLIFAQDQRLSYGATALSLVNSLNTRPASGSHIYAYSSTLGHNSYYLTDDAVWYLKEVTQIELKAANKKMVSLCYPFAVSLHRMPDTNANGSLWLYGATEDSRHTLKIQAQNRQSIPANTPAFIEQATPAVDLMLDIVYSNPPASTSWTKTPTTVKGVLAPQAISRGNYILKNVEDQGEMTAKLYLTREDGYTNPNKVYLRPWAPSVTPATRSISRAFAETTSIDEIEILDAPEPGEIYYDISGVRVFHPQGGIFVTARGRKVYIR